MPGSHTVIVYGLSRLKLAPKVSGIHVAGQIARPLIDPRVLIHLTAQEVRAVRPLLANNLGSLAIGRIIDEHGTALSHRIIFRLVERITPKVSDGTECLPLVGAHNTLGGIFNHEETVSLCDSHDFVHVAGNTRIMDGHDNSSLFGDGRLNGSRIDILRVG